ncbi:ArsR family transcriptional regulator, partial [Mycobacterium sp. ITM-2017-0098]
QHLKVLKAAGLVSDHAEGTRRVYRLNPAGIAALRADLDRFWTPALVGFKQIAEEQEDP